MTNKVVLEKLLVKLFTKEFKKKELQEASKKMFNKFDFPLDLASDYMTLKRPLNAATDFELFVLLYGADSKQLNKFYNESEIEKYYKQAYKMELMPDTFSFEVIEVEPDRQWIGKITTKELIQLRDNQRINYNENTQRSMRHVVQGGSDYYTIFLNNNAVESIMKCMEDGIYIPNTLTFNIPDDTDFEYNKKTKELVFRNLKCFDILDGYHRYIAISKCFTLDKSFEQSMEVRFVRFSESKANQFIFQEDQKTKMRKIDSNSMNQYDAANQIVKRLNEESNLSGLITRNNGIINAAEMANLIKLIYFPVKKIKKSDEKVEIIRVSNDLRDKINKITEIDTDLLKKTWDEKFLFLFLLASKEYDDVKVIYEKVKELLPVIEVKNIRYRKMPQKYIYSINEMMRGGE